MSKAVNRWHVPPVIGKIESGVPTVEVVAAADYDALAAELEKAQLANKARERPDCALQDRIRELEAALTEIADFSEQFIMDDEDGDERMYKVNQIADTRWTGKRSHE